jgi:hypothetical protein
MNQFRLHIDVPLGSDMFAARVAGQKFLDALAGLAKDHEVQYRLGHDTDRQKSNYYQINENGHCSNKKSRL